MTRNVLSTVTFYNYREVGNAVIERLKRRGNGKKSKGIRGLEGIS